MRAKYADRVFEFNQSSIILKAEYAKFYQLRIYKLKEH